MEVKTYSKRWMRLELHHSLVLKMSGKVDEAYEYLRDRVRWFLDNMDRSDARKGHCTSPKKAVASRINGQKGGRPRRHTQDSKKATK